MDSIRAGSNTQINVTVSATPGAGGAQANAGAASLGAGALGANSAQGLSQQMLEAYVALAVSWTGMLGGGDPQSLALPLWGNYQALVGPTQGNPGNPLTLSTPLRQNYAWMFAGSTAASDDFNVLSMPLRNIYNQLLNIPGMPPVPPMP